MADATYAAKVYMTDGGDELVAASSGAITLEDGGTIAIESGGEIAVASGGVISAAGTQASHIADGEVAYTSGELDDEAKIITAFNTTNTKINSILAALEGVGILASS